jgi:ribosomal protein S18 acetylase RimI-like enzyme
MEQNSPKPNLVFRPYQPSDYKALKAVMLVCYQDYEDAYLFENQLIALSECYPQGQIVCLLDGQLIGCILSRIAVSEIYKKPHAANVCADIDLCRQEAATGDSVYAIELFVLPEYQKLKIGRQLHQRLEKQIFEDNFYAMIAVSRLVNYHLYQHELDCETYVQKVKAREIVDGVLSFHLSNGGITGNVFANYSLTDKKSCGFGVFLQISNPAYEPSQPIYPNRNKLIKTF